MAFTNKITQIKSSLSRLDKVLSKFVFATKFAFANLALKTAAKVLNSEVVIYLS